MKLYKHRYVAYSHQLFPGIDSSKYKLYQNRYIPPTSISHSQFPPHPPSISSITVTETAPCNVQWLLNVKGSKDSCKSGNVSPTIFTNPLDQYENVCDAGHNIVSYTGWLNNRRYIWRAAVKQHQPDDINLLIQVTFIYLPHIIAYVRQTLWLCMMNTKFTQQDYLWVSQPVDGCE